jgi:hypothetical protein
MIATVGVVFIVTAVALTASTASAATAAWRTTLVANNEDMSEYAYIYDTNQTTLAKVHALRVRLSSTMTIKLTAEVKCDRGEARASRKVIFNQTAGDYARALPVPLAGGVCDIELDVSGSDPGRYELVLQKI